MALSPFSLWKGFNTVLHLAVRGMKHYNQECLRLDIETLHQGMTVQTAPDGLLWTVDEIEQVRHCDCARAVIAAQNRATALRGDEQ